MVPAKTTKRIVQLDALRGLAVIGIVWMNVYVFALPSQAYYNPAALGGASALDRIVWATSFVFVEDKFRTLFAMLFGAGCLMLLARDDKPQWRAHFARMLVLFVIGLLHSIVLASNDVLRAYALAGLVLPLFVKLSSRELYAVAIGLVVLHCAASLIVFSSVLGDYFSGRINGNGYLWAERNFGRDEAGLAAQYALGSEGFVERVFRRASQIHIQLYAVAASIPVNLAAMALGMALWKDRVLAAEWRIFRLQRLAAICSIVALPVLLGLAGWVASREFSGPLVATASLMFSAPFDMLLAIAYASLAMAFFADDYPIRERFAAVGRLSLTNYLATSVILAGIFATWGFGLFGQVSRSAAFALSFVPIIAMLIWSPRWVARFGQGPVERLWRFAAKSLS